MACIHITCICSRWPLVNSRTKSGERKKRTRRKQRLRTCKSKTYGKINIVSPSSTLWMRLCQWQWGVCVHFPISILSMLRSIKRWRWVKTRYINTIAGRMQHPRWNSKCIRQLRCQFSTGSGIFNWSPLPAPCSSISLLLHWNPFSLCVWSVLLCDNMKRSRWRQAFPHWEKKTLFGIHSIQFEDVEVISFNIFESAAYSRSRCAIAFGNWSRCVSMSAQSETSIDSQKYSIIYANM